MAMTVEQKLGNVLHMVKDLQGEVSALQAANRNLLASLKLALEANGPETKTDPRWIDKSPAIGTRYAGPVGGK
jgi:hypothetical protein